MVDVDDGVSILSYIAKLILPLYGVFIFILMLCLSLFHSLYSFYLSLHPLFLSLAVVDQDGHSIGFSPHFSASLQQRLMY
jgi:succinate-acetate transporter protein